LPISARALTLLLAFLCLPPAAVQATTTIDAVTLDGEAVRLTDYFEDRRWTLVMVWTTYCAVCAREFPVVDALHRAHRNDDFKVLGLAVEGKAERQRVATAMSQRQPTFDSLVADPDEVAAGYQRLTGETFDGTPTYLLFDDEGELAAHMSGPLETTEVERFIAERHKHR
jgi:thiol-disulfide isomerase/thioredoxin